MTRNACLSAKVRPLLSEQDEQDTRQTCAMVLCATGTLYTGTLTFGVWKECFRLARRNLRIDRQAKNKSEIVRIDAMTPEQVDCIAAETGFHALPLARRKVIARRIRYARACIAAKFQSDTTRQRSHNRRKALRMLRFCASHFHKTGEGMSEICDSKTVIDTTRGLRQSKAVFQKYLDKGEEILTASAMEGIPLKKFRIIHSLANI